MGQKHDANGLKSTRFECTAESAQAVTVAGTFNGWDPEATPLRCEEDGVWRADVRLSPGEYEYKFVVDGRWCCDPHCRDQENRGCPKCVPNPFGTMNRVALVE